MALVEGSSIRLVPELEVPLSVCRHCRFWLFEGVRGYDGFIAGCIAIPCDLIYRHVAVLITTIRAGCFSLLRKVAALRG